MSFKVTNFKEIECDNCHNHRTEDEFYNLDLGGLCFRCYQIAEKEGRELKDKIDEELAKQ